jgi:hypothetical protein
MKPSPTKFDYDVFLASDPGKPLTTEPIKDVATALKAIDVFLNAHPTFERDTLVAKRLTKQT